MKVSICMSTFNKPHLLSKTLESIYRQTPPFEFETIVVDDGSADAQANDICAQYPVKYRRIERQPHFRNPCIARNVAYRMACGDVIIAQSDEVLHITANTIEKLVETLSPGTFVLANVFCLDLKGKVRGEYTGPRRLAPLFFLGALYRSDLYAIGGNDEDFIVSPTREDVWFGNCLTNGLKLKPLYTTQIVGHHQWHTRSTHPSLDDPAREVYKYKHKAAISGKGKWEAASGPWPYTPGVGLDTENTFSTIHEMEII